MGQYLDITELLVNGQSPPWQVAQGSLVNIGVYVRNKHSSSVCTTVTASLNGINLQSRTPNYAWIPAGSTQYFALDIFTMPNKSITGAVGAWFLYSQNPDLWHEDDNKSLSIGLEGIEPPPTISGDIEGVRVKGTGTAWKTAPLTVEAGKQVSIRFDAHSGYGSWPTGLYFDATVILKKPSGATEERYDSQTTGPYSKCTLSRFIFGEGGLSAGWTANEQGTYYATIILRARTSLVGTSQEIKRITNLKVFTVTEETVPPPTISGAIESIRVKSGPDAWVTAPVTAHMGESVSIRFNAHSGYGAFPSGLYFDASVILRKPSGATEERYDSQTSGPYSKCTTSSFVFGAGGIAAGWDADEQGDYYADIILRARPLLIGSSQEIARITNLKVFTVTEASPPDPGEPGEPIPGVYDGDIRNIAVDWTALPSGEKPVPTDEPAPVGKGIRVSFEGWNLSTTTMRLRGEIKVFNPDGEVHYRGDNITKAPYSPNTKHKFIFPNPPFFTPEIDRTGEWTVGIRLMNSAGEYLLADHEGPLFTAEVPPEGMWGLMSSMMPLMMIMMMFGMMIPMMKDLGGEDKPKIRVVTEPKQLPAGRR